MFIRRKHYESLIKRLEALEQRAYTLEQRSVISVPKDVGSISPFGFQTDSTYKLPIDDALCRILRHLGIKFKYHGGHGPSCSIEKEQFHE